MRIEIEATKRCLVTEEKSNIFGLSVDIFGTCRCDKFAVNRQFQSYKNDILKYDYGSLSATVSLGNAYNANDPTDKKVTPISVDL